MDTGTLANRVCEVLRERILQGAYPPGQRLNLAQLSRDLKVSNTPLREAMARLERVGLVEIVPYSGPRVKRITRDQVIDICDVRMALEELALRLVLERNDGDGLHGMERALEAHERAGRENDLEAMVEADRAFHDALVQASGNSVLIEMLPTLSDRTRVVLELSVSNLDEPFHKAALRGVAGHRAILEALRAGDKQAAIQALHRELSSSKADILVRMPRSDF